MSVAGAGRQMSKKVNESPFGILNQEAAKHQFLNQTRPNRFFNDETFRRLINAFDRKAIKGVRRQVVRAVEAIDDHGKDVIEVILVENIITQETIAEIAEECKTYKV